jgi:hypothetical protein
MASTSQQPRRRYGVLKRRNSVLSTLDVSIQALNLAKDTCGIPQAQVAFGSASVLLLMIKVRFPPLYEDDPLAQAYTYSGQDDNR